MATEIRAVELGAKQNSECIRRKEQREEARQNNTANELEGGKKSKEAEREMREKKRFIGRKTEATSDLFLISMESSFFYLSRTKKTSRSPTLFLTRRQKKENSLLFPFFFPDSKCERQDRN